MEDNQSGSLSAAVQVADGGDVQLLGGCNVHQEEQPSALFDGPSVSALPNDSAPNGNGDSLLSVQRRISQQIFGGIERLGQQSPNLRILRDIVPAIGFRQGLELVKALCRTDKLGKASKEGGKAFGRFAAVIWHPEEKGENHLEERGHLHVYHSCVYNQSRCSCAFLRGFVLKRRLPRFVSKIGDFKAEDWDAWVQYFCSGDRRILHIQVGGVSLWRDVYQLELFGGTKRGEEANSTRAVESDGLSLQSTG